MPLFGFEEAVDSHLQLHSNANNYAAYDSACLKSAVKFLEFQERVRMSYDAVKEHLFFIQVHLYLLSFKFKSKHSFHSFFQILF